MPTDAASHMVPKVHPATRGVEPDDPMNLHGTEFPGDPAIMLAMLVEEFSRMGFGTAELLAMFRNPFFHAAHGLYLHFGEETLRDRIDGILSRSGVLRTRTVLADDAVPLVQLELPADEGGDHHA